ncbi:MAG: bifunctional UDP-N-acetylglucosamine diphosphorylase/glucosamine-1-phosphate N-acetyltransferase GlmU [Gammaproteobacteria bacterium]|nr:MAG: bifunctional UDP-N-acetylglucosamine diphosphorylase/glucosamine-1-phosphate N-acetyltransferase GlmU [Gammaproteobacteria bacterium]
MKSRLPKVLHRLAGRTLLEHVVAATRRLAPAEIHVVYGHGGAQVRDLLQALPVRWVEQPEQRGTGHAVEQAMPAIPDEATVLVLYADVPLIAAGTLQSTLDAAAEGALALITVEVADASGYGRILRGDDGRVAGIVEDKDASDAERAITEVNTGILAAGAASLRAWLARIDENNTQGERYLTDVIALAAGEGVRVHSVSPGAVEEVLGVNDRAQLAHLERHYQRRQAQRLMRDGVTIADPARVDIRGQVDIGHDVYLDVNVILEGKVTIAEGTRIGPNCVIKNAEIGAHTEIHANTIIEQASVGASCRIGPYARLRPGTSLAEEVHIGNFVEVKNTRVDRGSKANHLTYLGDSRVGKDVNIGAGTITCNYDGAEKHTTIIEDNVFVGSGVELVAPITLHAGATIGAGATVTRDVPAGVLSVSRGRQTTVENWTRPTKKNRPK